MAQGTEQQGRSVDEDAEDSDLDLDVGSTPRILPAGLWGRLSAAGFGEVEVDGAPVPDRVGWPDAVAAERAAATAGAGLWALPQLDPVVLRGAAVRRWTNSMFTNNTKRLKPGQGNRHCQTDDRGRILMVLDLYWLADDAALLLLEGHTVSRFAARSAMVLMLDDIALEPQPLCALHLAGPGADGLLAGLGLAAPAEAHGHAEGSLDGVGLRLCRKARSGLPGVDLLVPTAEVEAVWAALTAAGAAPCGWSTLEALRVEAGRARWPVDGGDKSLVHELSIDQETAAFDKGCYVGQEVLNRIDVKGQVQKKVLRVTLEGSAAPGAALLLEGETVGALRSVAPGGPWALALLRRSAWAAGTRLQVDGPGGAVVAVVG
jgi:folate-binding protein YgfZ